MCGLHGWVGKDPKTFNRHKFNILGILNEERGEHSSGIAIDGKLYKGANENKMNVWTDFIAGTAFPNPSEVPVVIGHTRRATGNSSYTLNNAHPFRFDINKKHHVIGAHNGVIRNYEELGKKYGIENINDKIDSEVLLEILANFRDKDDYPKTHNKNDQVFMEYIGAAAILLYNSKQPNVLWVFRGESRDPYSRNVGTTEERPLYFYQESEESMYISSIERSLFAICDNVEEEMDKIQQFHTNILYGIKDGKIFTRFEIDRTQVQPEKKTTTPSTNTSSSSTNSSCSTTPGRSSISERRRQVESQRNLVNAYKDIEIPFTNNSNKDYEKNNIFYEKVVFNNIKLDVYMENLRYKRNGHLCNGFYIFVLERGFVWICEEYENLYKNLKNFSLWDDESNEKIEFGDIRQKCKIFPILDGILLKQPKDYEELRKMKETGTEPTMAHLSEVSVYPVINWTKWRKANGKFAKGEGKIPVYADTQTIMYQGALYTGVIQPLGSFRKYTISYGNLEAVATSDSYFVPPIEDHYLSLFKDGLIEEGEDDNVDTTFEDDVNDSLKNHEASNLGALINLKNNYIATMEYTSESLERIPNSEIKKKFVEFNEDNIAKFKVISKTMNEIEKKMQHSDD